MPGIIEGYDYDIFISYRQKDNKGDRWVSELVESLKTELESTFKEDISVYFDINTRDGLLETHDVDASLKYRLKCLVFIPIISRTYCDPKSFAWENEFKAFVEQASRDRFGLKIKLLDGNVASRVLPIRIHDLDNEDIRLFESVVGGAIRGVEFIYRSAGVNRPLIPSDSPEKNLHKTFYRDQINKVANAVKEIIRGLKGELPEFTDGHEEEPQIVKRPIMQEKSIIVLPFENISPEAGQEYFSDGLTEEIITDLSHIHDLLVISRSSAMTFKGTKKKTGEIAKDVNVHYVLEGSVRKAGNNLRIAAQLIDGTTDSHVWAEKYSGTMDDIFDIQEKVSGSITRALKLRLSHKERNKVLERHFKDSQAFEYYLRAKQEINNFSEYSLNRAIDYIQKALNIEGGNSQLYAELAHVYYQFWNIGIRFEETDLEMSAEYVRKAFESDSTSPDGIFVSGLLEFTSGNMKKCIADFKKVLQISPHHANALLWLAMFYALLGNSSEAALYTKRLEKVDPFMPNLAYLPVLTGLYSGNLASAEEFSRKLGSDDFSIMIRSWALIYNNKCEMALDEINRVSEISKHSYMFRATFFLVYACLNHMKVIDLMDEKFLIWAKKDAQYSLFVAEIYAMINYKEDAINWLENSINRGMINYRFLSENDPLLENIRNDERFIELMEQIEISNTIS